MPPFTMATPELHTNHNVFILGAGFSADAGLPTIATFMRALREAGEHYKRSGDNQNANAIARVLEYRLRAAGAAYRCVVDPDNIEDLFSLIDTEDDSQGPGSQEDYIRQAIAATIEFSRKDYMQAQPTIRLSLPNAPGISPLVGEPGENEHFRKVHFYEAYLAAMTGMLYEPEPDRRDTIITFNYDTLVEEALASLKKSYDYGFLPEEYADGRGGGFVTIDSSCPEQLCRSRDEAAVRVLKLHGSVNWGLRYTQSDVPNQSVAELLVCPTFDATMSHGVNRIFIEPPTWRKGYGTQGRGITTVWHGALAALKTASRIIVIGYSLPLTDVHFRYLLAAGLRENISLQEILFVNPTLAEDAPGCIDMKSRVFQILRPELRDRNIIQFSGNILSGELIPQPYGQPVQAHPSSLFAKLNRNAGSRILPFIILNGTTT